MLKHKSNVIEILSITLSHDQNRLIESDGLIITFNYTIILYNRPIHHPETAIVPDRSFLMKMYFYKSKKNVRTLETSTPILNADKLMSFVRATDYFSIYVYV